MNCAEFDEIVDDLDRRRAGGPTDSGLGSAGATAPWESTPSHSGSGAFGPSGGNLLSEAALAHAESCSRCARFLTEIEGLNFALHAIAAHDAQEQAPVAVETALLQAFREQADTRAVHGDSNWQIAGKPRSYGWYAAVASVAAVVLIAFVLLRSGLMSGPHQPVADPTGAIAGASPGSKTPLSAEHPVVSPDLNGTAKASAVNGPRAQVPTTAEAEATAFYALPYADDAASLEGGAVIRVSVPRSALVSWGLPVPGVGGAEPIPADMLVSADGTPQAIRLVSETNE